MANCSEKLCGKIGLTNWVTKMGGKVVWENSVDKLCEQFGGKLSEKIG